MEKELDMKTPILTFFDITYVEFLNRNICIIFYVNHLNPLFLFRGTYITVVIICAILCMKWQKNIFNY